MSVATARRRAAAVLVSLTLALLVVIAIARSEGKPPSGIAGQSESVQSVQPAALTMFSSSGATEPGIGGMDEGSGGEARQLVEAEKRTELRQFRPLHPVKATDGTTRSPREVSWQVMLGASSGTAVLIAVLLLGFNKRPHRQTEARPPNPW